MTNKNRIPLPLPLIKVLCVLVPKGSCMSPYYLILMQLAHFIIALLNIHWSIMVVILDTLFMLCAPYMILSRWVFFLQQRFGNQSLPQTRFSMTHKCLTFQQILLYWILTFPSRERQECHIFTVLWSGLPNLEDHILSSNDEVRLIVDLVGIILWWCHAYICMWYKIFFKSTKMFLQCKCRWYEELEGHHTQLDCPSQWSSHSLPQLEH